MKLMMMMMMLSTPSNSDSYSTNNSISHNFQDNHVDCETYKGKNTKNNNNDAFIASTIRFVLFSILIAVIVIIIVLQAAYLLGQSSFSSLSSPSNGVHTTVTTTTDTTTTSTAAAAAAAAAAGIMQHDLILPVQQQHDDSIPENMGDYDSVVDSIPIVSQQRRRLQQFAIPQFIGGWENITNVPLRLGEAHGGLLQNRYFILTGGFLAPSITKCNRRTYILDVAGQNLTGRVWSTQSMHPYPLGVTHAAEAFNKDFMFLCGGYDGYPGLVQDDCYAFDRLRPPNSVAQPQYISYPPLPGPRAGGGLIYDAHHNSLLYVGGTRRNVTADKITLFDMNDTFVLPLDNVAAGWRNNTAKKPYSGNHLSFVTVNDTCSGNPNGVQRHYIFGGQIGQNETQANLNKVYEYNMYTDTWTQRQSMPFGRGHTSTAVVPMGCGFIVSGGAINSNKSTIKLITDDISYYSTVTDTWTSIGKLPEPLKTLVCGIVYNTIENGSKTYLFCSTGYTNRIFRRQIALLQ